MIDKVQKIREEVVRLRNLHQMKYQQIDTNDNMCLVECGKRNLCNELLSFIDSMQEEPKFKIGQIIADPEDKTFTFHINRIENGKYIESDDAWVLIKDADEEYQLVEEPVSEDLEEEVIKKVLYFSENFHKAPWAIDSTGAVMPIWYAKFGANWQKQKMMKDAVEREVFISFGGNTVVRADGFSEGDRVKVIIIKEE